MATSGVAIRFQQHGLQIAQSIVTYSIWSGMSVFGASIPRTNLEILLLLTSNTPSGITTYIGRTAMATPRRPMPNSCPAFFTED